MTRTSRIRIGVPTGVLAATVVGVATTPDRAAVAGPSGDPESASPPVVAPPVPAVVPEAASAGDFHDDAQPPPSPPARATAERPIYYFESRERSDNHRLFTVGADSSFRMESARRSGERYFCLRPRVHRGLLRERRRAVMWLSGFERGRARAIFGTMYQELVLYAPIKPNYQAPAQPPQLRDFLPHEDAAAAAAAPPDVAPHPPLAGSRVRSPEGRGGHGGLLKSAWR